MDIQIGTMVSVNHPITVLNPDKYFEVVEIKFDISDVSIYKVWVRGEKTCWFNANMITEAKTMYEDGDTSSWKREIDEYA